MSKMLEATQAVADGLDGLRDDMRDRARPEPEQRGYVSELRVPDWLAVALRLCVDRDAGDSLARHVRLVPGSHRRGNVVWCLCGMEPQSVGRVSECWGGCGRFFCADERTVWSIRLPRREVTT